MEPLRRSIVDDDAGGPQSLFVVVSYGPPAPRFSSILRLQLKNPKKKKTFQVTEKDYVVSFMKPGGFRPLFRWSFSPPTSSTGYIMYVVPEYDHPETMLPKISKPLPCTKFNFSTGECLQIDPPMASKFYGHVVNWRGLIFFMSHPGWYYDTPDPVFECYDPDKDMWKALHPFPIRTHVYPNGLSIVATAVFDDTILYNVGSCEFWAYDVARDEWYIVHVEDDLCYCIVGEAVVIENTIYALTGGYPSHDLLLALSIERVVINGDPVYNCSLRSQISVPDLEVIKYKQEGAHAKSRHLVHLGGDNFCVVQSCMFRGDFDRYHQPIQLTRVKRTGEDSMIVKDIILYEVEVLCEQQFKVRLCFPLPDKKTTAFEEGKGFTISLDPESEFRKPDQAPTRGDGAVPGRRNTVEEGHTVFVKNLPPDASLRELAEELKKFGPIMRDVIHVSKSKEGNCCFASAEFERATSKLNAIKASPIGISGCQVEVKGKENSDWTSSSNPSVENKFKNHGDDSRSKKTQRKRNKPAAIGQAKAGALLKNKLKNHDDDFRSKTTLKGKKTSCK